MFHTIPRTMKSAIQLTHSTHSIFFVIALQIKKAILYVERMNEKIESLADQQRTLTVEDRIIRHNVTLTYCAFVLIARKKIESLRTV